MRYTKQLLIIFTFIAFLSSCVSTSRIRQANSIVAPGAQVGAYKTYAWYQEQPVREQEFEKGFGPALGNRIKHAIEEELRKKGYSKVATNPDVLVAYDVSVSVPLEKDEPGTYPEGFGYSYAYMVGYRYNYSNTNMPGYRAVDLFKQGTLIIDLINPANNQLVWRGWNEEAISNFNARANAVQQEVAEILNKLKAAPGGQDRRSE